MGIASHSIIKSPGKIKFHFERIRGYATIPTQIAGILASLKILGFSLWWAIALIPIGYVVHLLDKKYVLKDEVEQGFIIGKEVLKDAD